MLTSTLVAVGSPCWKDSREHITPAPHLLGSWGHRSPPARVTAACHKLGLISKRGNQEGRMLNLIGPGVPRRAGTSLPTLLPVVQRISPLQASGPPAQAPLCVPHHGVTQVRQCGSDALLCRLLALSSERQDPPWYSKALLLCRMT